MYVARLKKYNLHTTRTILLGGTGLPGLHIINNTIISSSSNR